VANAPLLSLLIWLPMLGGAIALMLGERRAALARWVALATAFVALLLSVPLFTGLDHTTAAMQFTEAHAWIPAYDIRYALGADGISVALIGLTTLTTVLVLIGAWGSVDERVNQYVAAFLILEGLMIGVFCALDAMLFYVFFEAMLIPMFIIIACGAARGACMRRSSSSCTPSSGRCSCWSASSTCTSRAVAGSWPTWPRCR
jgi:NADH-quinone oxidoreductase subunit M